MRLLLAHLLALALAWNAALAQVNPAADCDSSELVDGETLPRLLKERGFVPGPDFKALVVVITDSDRCGLQYRYFDHAGTSAQRDNWWPASTVKLFAAVAALAELREAKFTPQAKITFHYREAELGEVTVSLEELVRKALTPSDNTAFDRLVELVGYERLNDWYLSDEYRLGATVLQRAYGGRHKFADTGKGSLRHSPPITITEDKRTRELPERTSDKLYDCPQQGNCTTLLNLAEAMRRVMLHSRIGLEERFCLTKTELKLLHQALSASRERGLGVVNGLKEAMAGRKLEVFHKPGFASQWFSDNVFLRDAGSGEQWIVAIANRPGRDACDEGARQIGRILHEGLLK